MNRRLHTVDYSGKGKRYADKRSGRAGRRIKHAKYGKKSALFRAAALLGVLLCVRLVLPARAQSKTEDAFCFPLETTQWRISDGYGWREDPFTGKRAFHKGIDLACAEGTGILAVRDGTVLRTKRSASYGSCMELLLADGTAAVYAHLQYIYVRPGEAVESGQLLGTAGQSGRATGAHLHFELYRQGKACDPADALGLSHEAS